MEIKILGSGCANCERLERVVREAVAELGADATFEKVSDYAEIMSYGVMTTPALVVDGQLLFAGRVPGVGDVVARLQGSGRDSAQGSSCDCGGGCC
jgi:small redox-active disulfide protein 2